MKLKHWIKEYRREQYRERGRREFAAAIHRIFKPRFERMIEAFNKFDKGGLPSQKTNTTTKTWISDHGTAEKQG